MLNQLYGRCPKRKTGYFEVKFDNVFSDHIYATSYEIYKAMKREGMGEGEWGELVSPSIK